MLTIDKPIYFGSFHRFQAYTHTCTVEICGEHLTHVFVRDAEQIDECGLPLVIFLEDANKLDNVKQVIDLIWRRYPEAFDYTDESNPKPEQDDVQSLNSSIDA